MLVETPNPYRMQVVININSFSPVLRIYNNDKYHDFDLEAAQDQLNLSDEVLDDDHKKAKVLGMIVEELKADPNFGEVTLHFLKTYMLFLQDREKSQA